MLRIVFQNIGGLLQNEEMKMKLEAMRHLVSERDIDTLGFTESNTWWDLFPESQQLSQQTRGWWETSQWSLGYNQWETNKSPHQLGGTGILCVNQVAHWELCPGDDLLGLGWWC